MKISCHSGNTKYKNNLSETIKILDKYPIIDMVDIDVLYKDNEFVVSHDYFDTNEKHSLVEWIEVLIGYNKMIWLDLKDTFSSEISIVFTEFNFEEFEQLLQSLSKDYFQKGIKLSDYIILGIQCQGISRHIKLFDSLKQYIQVQDLPYIKYYMYKKIIPKRYHYRYNQYVQRKILEKIENVDNVIGLDSTFFNNEYELNYIINRIKSNIIIVYFDKVFDYKIYENKTNKHIILQYDFFNIQRILKN